MLVIGLVALVATYLLRFIPIPAIYIYKTPIQLVSVVLIAVGVYMAGAISNQEAFEARVKEMELKVAEAEAEASKENVKIVEKVVKKIEIVRVQGQQVTKYIDREVVKYDTKFVPGGECEIPKEFIKAHNDATEQLK
jgi:hypothetical protein